MNETPPASQFPAFSFRPGKDSNAAATPGDLHAFLQKLISESLSGVGRISAAEKSNWVALIDGLSENFLETFPSSSSVSWKALEEKIKLCVVSLEVIVGASSRVESLYLDSDEHARLSLFRLFAFLRVLTTWDAHSSSSEIQYSSYTIRGKAIYAIDKILESLLANGSGKSILYSTVRESSLRSVRGPSARSFDHK